MKAAVWHGPRDVRVDEVDDPKIEEATDAIVRITSSAICGSDLHLYEVLSPFMEEGDILGHEPMGIVEEVGSEVQRLKPGDRVVVPFNISCGQCRLCAQGLQSQCETTQNRAKKKGASLFGYTHLYGGVPGGQAEFLRVPLANYGPIVVPEDAPDDAYLLLSDVLPTAWQAVVYAEVPKDGTLGVCGLGPIGQMCCRVAFLQGARRVIGVDHVAERLAMAQRHGVDIVDMRGVDSVPAAVRELTDGLGVDSAIDAVGMEADAGPVQKLLQKLKVAPDRYGALLSAVRSLRRGGTLSIAGVYMARSRSAGGALRPPADGTHGPGERPPLGGRDRPVAPRRRPPRRERPQHPPPAARTGAGGEPHVPGEAERRGEGRPQALTPTAWSDASTARSYAA
jgi:threonine dehydrogenase-like Zn-dependent dehydrogenase